MSNKNKKPKPRTELHIPVPENMTAEEARGIIVEALLTYDEAKQQQERDRKQAEHEEWQKKLGIKKYDDKPRFIRPFLNLLNSVAVVLRFLFMRKSKISGDHALTGLMRMSVSIFFGLAKVMLWVISLCLFLNYPIQCIAKANFGVSAQQYITHLPLSVLAFFGAQVFRMASIEIEEIEDKNIVFNAFTAVAAIAAIIASIVHH